MAANKHLRKQEQYFDNYAFDLPGCTEKDRAPQKIEFAGQPYWLPGYRLEKDGFCTRCGEYHYRVWFGRISYSGQPMPNNDPGYSHGFETDGGVVSTKKYFDVQQPTNPTDQDDDYNLSVIEEAHDYHEHSDYPVVPQLEKPIPEDPPRRKSETTREYLLSLK